MSLSCLWGRHHHCDHSPPPPISDLIVELLPLEPNEGVTPENVQFRPFKGVQIVSSADWAPGEHRNITVVGTHPLTDENGDVIYLMPGTFSLGIICIYCGYNAMDSCEPDEDSKEMMEGVRADFNRHMLEVHGIDNE